MRRLHGLELAIVVVLLCGAGCRRESTAVATRDNEVLVLCGGSMRAVLEELKARYEALSDDRILTTYGGSGELCAQIQQTARGDLYLCHDPFMPWAAKQKLVADWERVATLNIVGIVPQDNPKQLKRLEDLARPGVRLGIGDRTYSTSGQIVKHILASHPRGEAILENVRMETKGHQQRCNDVTMGTLDAALVWDAVAHQYKDRLLTFPVPTDGLDAITSATYQQSDLSDVGVTLGIIAGAADRDAARRFYDFVLKEGAEVFKEGGFGPAQP